MSTSILYSGQARTIAQCLKTQHWHVFRHFADLHFFVLWQHDANAVEGVKLLEAQYGANRVHARLIDDPTDLPLIPQHYGDHAPYSNMGVPHRQLLMQHWYQREVWRLWNNSPDGVGGSANTIIRMRGDNFFHRLSRFDYPGENECYTPWWGRFGGVADRFAIMGPKAAPHYFTLYDNIQSLLEAGCPFHPESLLAATLQKGGVEVYDDLLAEFSTRRADGTDRRWESEIGPDISQFVR